MTYQAQKEQFIASGNFLAEGVFFSEGLPTQISGFISQNGTIYTENRQDFELLCFDPFSNDVLIFDSNGMRAFCFPDHTSSEDKVAVANYPGVTFTEELKGLYLFTAQEYPQYSSLSLESSDKEFYDFVNFFVKDMLAKEDHPQKNIVL